MEYVIISAFVFSTIWFVLGNIAIFTTKGLKPKGVLDYLKLLVIWSMEVTVPPRPVVPRSLTKLEKLRWEKLEDSRKIMDEFHASEEGINYLKVRDDALKTFNEKRTKNG